jgi:tRNA modification GTPase
MANSYESGRIIHDGVNLTIAGKPNAGKSTIFNNLLNENRAIVSHIPGTTRDYLQEPLVMGGLVFNLVDTAGLREVGDFIEAEGVRRSYSKIENADIILNVIDLTQNGGTTLNELGDVEADKITIYNKMDI